MGKVVARCRVLREIWRNFGGIVDSPLLTNDFAWYMYIIRRWRRTSKEESRWIRPDKTGSELLIVPVFDLREYNGLIELPPVEFFSFFLFWALLDTLVNDNWIIVLDKLYI